MTAFNGTFTDSLIGLAPFQSAQLSAVTNPYPFGGVSVESNAQFGTLARAIPAAIPSPWAGTFQGEFGQELFNKVIVTPSNVALGFVLAANVFNVSVWSTFVTKLQVLQTIQITGSGNLGLTNPPGKVLPLPFGPGQAYTFVATIPQAGDATINDLAVWTFLDSSVTGATLAVTGLRITLFTPDPNWSADFIEDMEFSTVIMRSFADSEQRYSLRKHPRTRLAFRVTTLAQLDTNALDALLFGWQARVYGVPFWPDAQQLSVTLNPGDTVVTLPTTANMKFTAGGIAMVWRNMQSAAALSVQSVSPTTITLTNPVTQQWLADKQTWVVPVLSGRVPPSLDVPRITSTMAEVDLEFECEVI